MDQLTLALLFRIAPVAWARSRNHRLCRSSVACHQQAPSSLRACDSAPFARLGPQSETVVLCNVVLPALKLEVIDAELHARAMAAFLTSSPRRFSFVDCSSFELMRSLGLSHVFAFDPHFVEQGFRLLATA